MDGDPFTSVFEGPRAFEILRVDGDNVYVRFQDEPDIAWEDTVVVKDGRIDDVLYGGAGDFNPPGRLSNRLKARDEAVTIDVSPQPAYLSADATGQALSVDLILRNHTAEPLDLDEVQVSVFDRANELVLRKFIDGNGARPSIRTADVPEIAAGGKVLIFNPFHELAPEVELHTVRFDLKLSSKDGSRRHTARAVVKPDVRVPLRHLVAILQRVHDQRVEAVGEERLQALELFAVREAGGFVGDVGRVEAVDDLAGLGGEGGSGEEEECGEDAGAAEAVHAGDLTCDLRRTSAGLAVAGRFARAGAPSRSTRR